MSKIILSYNDFSSGVLSPTLYSRTTVDEYKSGLQVCTNAYVLPQGPVRRRNGFKLQAEVKDSSVDVRLIDYVVNRNTSYMVEAGNQYLRFFSPSGQILESNVTISGATQADPVVITATSHGYSNGDYIYITGVVGMTELNSSTVPYKVASATTNTFEITDVDDNNIDGSAFTAYSSGGVANKIYEIASPYTTAQLNAIQWVQDGTTLYMVHPDVSPRKLIRTSDTSWAISEIDFYPPPTYEAGYDPNSMTMTPAATTGTGVNFTASSGIFLEGDIGRQIVNLSDGETGRASITSITSTTVAVCDIVEDFTDTNAIAAGDWKFDLSPLVDLEFDASSSGAIVNIRSEYNAGSLGSRLAITAVTQANPGVVTSNGHGLSNGQKVQIQDIVGMTQINDKIFTVDGVTTNTFQLKGENTSGYTAYSSGGIARQKLDDINKDAFRSDDVGKYILANGGVMQIVSVNSADDVDAEIIKSMNSNDTTGNWTLEEKTWNATRGQPSAVALHEQRLWLGGTDAQPNTINGSEIGIFTGFGAGPDDEDAISVELESSDKISWMRGGRDFVVGTVSAEYTITSSSNGSLTPSDLISKARTTQGSDSQQTLKIGDEILFVDSSADDLISFRYDFNIDGYRDTNLMFLAEHLPPAGNGIKEISYAKSPDTLLYSVLNDGDMLVTTYDRSIKVIGTSKYTTFGSFERVRVLPNSTTDQVWVVTKRTINGSDKRFIETYADGDGTDDEHAFADSWLSLNSPTTITAITAANPAVITANSHGLSNGDSVIIKNVKDAEELDLDSTKTNMSDLNNGIYTVANSTSNTFELSGVDTSAYNAYGSGGEVFERVTSLTGLDHLEGRTVKIRADGATLADETVTNGAITLDDASGEIVIGLGYTTTITTLDKEFDIGMGSMLGQRAQWVKPLVRVNSSYPPTINGTFIPSRNTDDNLSQKVPLYTGYFEYGPLTNSNTTQLTFNISEPQPLEITGITGTVSAGVI